MFWLEAKYSIPQEFVYQKLYVCSQGLFSVGVFSFAYIVLYSEDQDTLRYYYLVEVVVHCCCSEGFADVVKPPVNASPEPKKIIKSM